MSVRRRLPPRVKNTMVQTTLVDVDAATSQSHQRLVAGIEELESGQNDRSKVTATLAAGSNIVNHGLGRKPTAVHVTPTVVDAGFGYALSQADTKQATVITTGSTQPSAVLEFS